MEFGIVIKGALRCKAQQGAVVAHVNCSGEMISPSRLTCALRDGLALKYMVLQKSAWFKLALKV